MDIGALALLDLYNPIPADAVGDTQWMSTARRTTAPPSDPASVAKHALGAVCWCILVVSRWRRSPKSCCV